MVTVRCGGKAGSRVAAFDAPWRVGPVQRRIDGKKVRQEMAGCVLQIVDPRLEFASIVSDGAWKIIGARWLKAFAGP